MEDNNKKSDLKINGIGSVPGGEYNLVRINGRGKIEGDVTCKQLVINGSGDVSGSVNSSLMHINGTGHIIGAVKTGELKARGGATFEADVSCDSVSVSGTAAFSENLNAKTVKISGSAKIGKDCSADSFSSTGLFKIAGLLSADTIDVNLGLATSTADEVGGESITIKLAAGLGVVRSIFTAGSYVHRFETNSIEGNEILLESTKAKVVRGHNITIGEGCDIELVEYTGVLKKTGNAKVAEEKKI